jgi:hypothetical protein
MASLRRRTAPLYKLERDLRDRFETEIRALPHVEIVITSSWREAFSLSEIRGHFSPDIAARIVGTTLIASNRDGTYREREVRAYLRKHATEGDAWLAIDDDPLHFGPDASVLLVDPDHGLDYAALAKMRAALVSQ